MGTFSYLASFDVEDARNGFGAVTFSRASASSFVITLLTDVTAATGDLTGATGSYNHYPFGLGASDAEDALRTDILGHVTALLSLRERMTQVMQSKAAAAGWASSATLTCVFDATTLRYTFNYGGGQAFTGIAFSTLATRNLFGFSADFAGSSGVVSGTLLPDYIVKPILRAVTTEGNEGVNYEPSGLSMSAQTPWGSAFGRTRTVPPLYRDWTQQAETKVKTIRANPSLGFLPAFTHQSLFEKCRSVQPFVVQNMYGDGVDYVFKLRPDACVWSPAVCERSGGNDTNDAQFNVHYAAQVLGKF